MRILTSLILFLLFCLPVMAQDVIYEFANAQQTTSGGNTFYDVDILVSTSSDFKMGSGQLYFDYNPQAFGNSVTANNRVNVTTAGYILGQLTGSFGIYGGFTTNDNTSTRVSFSWLQSFSSGCITGDNVTGTAMPLFHLQLQFMYREVRPFLRMYALPLRLHLTTRPSLLAARWLVPSLTVVLLPG